MKRSVECGEELPERKSFTELLSLGRTVDMRILAGFSHLSSNLVHHYGRSGLRHEREVENLDKDAEDELDPDVPSPGQEGLYKPSDNGSNDGAGDGREDNIRHGILLGVGLPHVGNHA